MNNRPDLSHTDLTDGGFSAHWGEQYCRHRINNNDKNHQSGDRLSYPIWVMLCKRLGDGNYIDIITWIKEFIDEQNERAKSVTGRLSKWLTSTTKNYKIEDEIDIWNLRTLEILCTEYLSHKVKSNQPNVDIVSEVNKIIDQFVKPLVREVINPVLNSKEMELIDVDSVDRAFKDTLIKNVQTNYVACASNDDEFLHQWRVKGYQRNQYRQWIRLCREFPSHVETGHLDVLSRSIEKKDIDHELDIWSLESIERLVGDYLAHEAKSKKIDVDATVNVIATELVKPLVDKINAVISLRNEVIDEHNRAIEEKYKILQGDDKKIKESKLANISKHKKSRLNRINFSEQSFLDRVAANHDALNLSFAASDDQFRQHWGRQWSCDTRNDHMQWIEFCRLMVHYFGSPINGIPYISLVIDLNSLCGLNTENKRADGKYNDLTEEQKKCKKEVQSWVSSCSSEDNIFTKVFINYMVYLAKSRGLMSVDLADFPLKAQKFIDELILRSPIIDNRDNTALLHDRVKDRLTVVLHDWISSCDAAYPGHPVNVQKDIIKLQVIFKKSQEILDEIEGQLQNPNASPQLLDALKQYQKQLSEFQGVHASNCSRLDFRQVDKLRHIKILNPEAAAELSRAMLALDTSQIDLSSTREMMQLEEIAAQVDKLLNPEELSSPALRFAAKAKRVADELNELTAQLDREAAATPGNKLPQPQVLAPAQWANVNVVPDTRPNMASKPAEVAALVEVQAPARVPASVSVAAPAQPVAAAEPAREQAKSASGDYLWKAPLLMSLGAVAAVLVATIVVVATHGVALPFFAGIGGAILLGHGGAAAALGVGLGLLATGSAAAGAICGAAAKKAGDVFNWLFRSKQAPAQSVVATGPSSTAAVFAAGSANAQKSSRVASSVPDYGSIPSRSQVANSDATKSKGRDRFFNRSTFNGDQTRQPKADPARESFRRF